MNRRRAWTLTAVAVLATSLVAVSGATTPADAAVSNSHHPFPSTAITGVTRLCGPDAAYSCTTGGYNGASTGWWGAKYGAGYASSNSHGYHNCTLYAAYRVAQNGVKDPGWHGNADQWPGLAASHGTPVNQTPAVGAVAEWNGTASNLGHVAYVETVTSTYIEVTDDNYALNYTDRWRIALNSTAMPDNFIHFKDLGGASGPVPDGTFISYGGNVFRIAGGAPMYVSNWAAFGGAQPTTAVTAPQWNALNTRPANGTDITAAGNGTVYRIAGGAPLLVTTCTIGTTNFCADAIAVDPYDISHMDHLNPVPTNGTDLAVAISTGGTGSVYRVVGGAPLVVTSCSIGTTTFCGDSVPIDGYAISHLDHLNPVPANGSDLALASGSGGTGSVYRVVGGAPLIVSTCTIGTTNFCTDTVPIDPYAVSHLDHLNPVPVNGSDLALAQATSGTGTVYRTAGGAPLVATACTIGTADFCADAVAVDPYAITHLDHLNRVPTDGTDLAAARPDTGTGPVYRVAGGALFATPSCTVNGVSFCADTTTVDPYAIAHLDHLQPNPSAGTVVQAVPSNGRWVFNGKCRARAQATAAPVTVADAGLLNFRTCNQVALSHAQSRSTVTYGKPVKLSTQATDTTASVTLNAVAVELQRKSGKSWATVRTVRTNAGGVAATTVMPSTTTVYRWWIAPRITTSAYSIAASSGTFTVRVALSGAIPTITGKVAAGRTLTAHTSTWRPSGIHFRYQWYVDHRAVSRATTAQLRLARAWIRKTVTVQVTGSKTGYVSAAKTSRPTPKVSRH